MVKTLVVDLSPLADIVDGSNLQYLRDRDQPPAPPIDVDLLTEILSGDNGDGEVLQKFCTYSDNTDPASAWSTYFYDDLMDQRWNCVKDDCEDDQTIVQCLRDVGNGFNEPKDGIPGHELVVVLGEVTRTVAHLLLGFLGHGFCVRIYLSEHHLSELDLEEEISPCVKACALQLDSSTVSRFIRQDLRPAEVARLVPADAHADALSGDEADVESHDGDVRSVVDLCDDSDDESQGSDASGSTTHNTVSSGGAGDDNGNDEQDQASASDGASSEESEDGADEINTSEEEGSRDLDTDSCSSARNLSSEEDNVGSDDSDSDPEGVHTTLGAANRDTGRRREDEETLGGLHEVHATLSENRENRQDVIEISDSDEEGGNHDDVHEISDSDDGSQAEEARRHRAEDRSGREDVHVVSDEDQGHQDVIETSSDDESQASEVPGPRAEDWSDSASDDESQATEIFEDDLLHQQIADAVPDEYQGRHQDMNELSSSDGDSQTTEGGEYSEEEADQVPTDDPLVILTSNDDAVGRQACSNPSAHQRHLDCRDDTSDIEEAAGEASVRTLPPPLVAIAILAVVIAVSLAILQVSDR
jgi:hypothetical protein